MSKQKYESIWDAIEDTPGEAENMKARSSLMIAIAEHIKAQGLTQAAAAKRLAITQPRVSDLIRGKTELFSLDALVNMLASAGLRVDIRIAESLPA